MFLEKTKFDIICLTEHWLNDHQIMSINYENYCVVSYFSRKCMIHGGSLILIKNSVKSKERKDIIRLSVEHSIELSCVELDKHVVVCVYRPPGYQNLSVFDSVMEDVLKKLSTSSKSIIISGDFNINLLETNSNSIRLISLFKSFNLSNVFMEPTRVTASSATCIDNIFCNCDYLHKEIVNKLPSDHSGQTITFCAYIPVQKIQIRYRPITCKNLEKLNNTLTSKLCVQNFNNIWDPNEFYAEFFTLLKSQFNDINPQKTKSIYTKFLFSDWATPGIRKSRDKLFELYGLRQHVKNTNFHQHVAKYSKTFKSVCKIAKALYISNKIKSADDKIKTTWQIINNETGRKKQRNTLI
ncbi:uncharacterized protein LOC125050811 [Pieris napi]|uniref:uncharacterized protein LOC125050811 n=1 Tax=Pieris napi TaxID=78633 RepID=UPI001FB9F280|nr:uncharacterized protein LOC125050811 [Pieris napi]